MTLRLAPEAEKDLDDIWVYIARASGELERADHFIELLIQRFGTLSEFPHAGRRCNVTIDPNLRSFAVGEFIVLYRVVEEAVVIIRVLRGSRNLEDLLES